MPTPNTAHATFTLERRYPASPDHVFAAWANPSAKKRWFAGEDAEHSLDFRVGGTEVTRGKNPEGDPLTAESIYRDIVPNERIVFGTTLSVADTLATVSITTVEFATDGAGTHLTLTEQDTFLDGHEQPEWRQQGTRHQLDALAKLFEHDGDLP